MTEKNDKLGSTHEEIQPMLSSDSSLKVLKNVEFQKINENSEEKKNPCPKGRASYLSQLVYFWAGPFVWQGYKNPITLSNLWDLDSNLTSNKLVPKFEAALNPLIEKARSKNISDIPAEKKELDAEKSKESLDLTTEKDVKNETKKGFSLLPALVKKFGASFFLGAFMQITVAG